jgi:tripartite-type tricarboxylate transporter receptor subunit TctC
VRAVGPLFGGSPAVTVLPLNGIPRKDATMSAALPALAHEYPTKPVRLIEPFGRGGGPDVIARALAPKLSGLWCQSVTVENHPGDGATAAPALVAKSPPDGHTLLINTSAQAYTAALSMNLPYDPLLDLIPVAPLTTQSYVFVVGKQAGVTTISELIAAANARPGELTFGSSGMGTGSHLGVEKFNMEASIRTVHVPAGPADAIADSIANTVAGRTTYAMWPVYLALSKILDGSLVALAVSGARRSRQLPQVPTVAEAGVVGYDFPIWYGMWTPAGTPLEVAAKVAQDIASVLAGPDLREELAEHGAEPMSMTQPEFEAFVLSETDSAARIIRAVGI